MRTAKVPSPPVKIIPVIGPVVETLVPSLMVMAGAAVVSSIRPREE